MTENERDLIDACCDNFDFIKVEKTMTALEWKWSSTQSVPTQFEIRQHVRKAFKSAIKRSTYVNGDVPHVEGSGGFEYRVFREQGRVVHVKLAFVVEQSEYDVEWLGE